MELNVSLVELAIEMHAKDNRLLAANISFWEDVPKHRASLDHLFSTLLVVVGNKFGDIRVPLPWTPPHTVPDNYWKIYRFGFMNGFIPVFSSTNVDGTYNECVVVPSEADGVLMAAFVAQLEWPNRVGDPRRC